MPTLTRRPIAYSTPTSHLTSSVDRRRPHSRCSRRRREPRDRRRQDRARRTSLVREANPYRSNHPRRIAAVERLRRLAERLILDAAVHVPGAEAGRSAERHRDDSGDAEVTELVVSVDRCRGCTGIQLVIVREAEANLDRQASDALDAVSVSYTHLRAHETPEHL